MVSFKSRQKTPKKVVNKETKKDTKAKDNGKSSNQNAAAGGFYYSFLTVVLLLCLIQVTGSAVLNISKVVSYNSKIKQIANTRDAAKALNEQLNDSIKNFSNVAGLEAIARNNLKMSSEDEVMVIINTQKEENKEEKPKKFWGLR